MSKPVSLLKPDPKNGPAFRNHWRDFCEAWNDGRVELRGQHLARVQVRVSLRKTPLVKVFRTRSAPR